MFSKNAQIVLEQRYLLKNESGEVAETIEGLFRRVAQAVASAESVWGTTEKDIETLSERFYQSMITQCFMPNTPTLMNAGKARGQLSACFVLPVPDSLEKIFETCKNAAIIHKTGGGTGFSFSQLRPAGDSVDTTIGVASGPISFMTVYDAATEVVRQGGTRRGANMGILNVDHPDIEKFISCKRQTERLNNFNISVALTEDFMKAVEEDRDFDLVHPNTKKPVRTVSARALFELMAENAHATGEPGIIFLDRINTDDPMIMTFDSHNVVVPGTEDIEATNPCGEQPLGPGDACTLGSINLSKFVSEQTKDFDWALLGDQVDLGVRFLDDVVQANRYPLEFIATASLNNRRIGLGVMGWAEALIKLGIAYNSEVAVKKASELMSFIQTRAHAASSNLASNRGNFPNWTYSKWAQKHVPMRNATVTTIAPTGTISTIAGTTSGIEPVFAICFVRRILGGKELIETNALFIEMAKAQGFYSDELLNKIAVQGTVQNILEIPEETRKLWVCAHEIAPSWHLKMQAAFQAFTDCAVSKTINLPKDSTVDDVRQAFLMAYRCGLKGLTVYRDTSRAFQVLNVGASGWQDKS